MSELFEARRKTEDAANWRGEINVTVADAAGNEDTLQLSVRQLFDPELWDVMTKVDLDELKSLQQDLPEEKMERFRELQSEEDLEEEEKREFERIQEEIEEKDINIFEELSMSTYEGLMEAAKYGVVPDETDVQQALSQHADEIEQKYGAMSNDAAKDYIQDHEIDPLIERSTNLSSFAMGVKVLGETLGDTKN